MVTISGLDFNTPDTFIMEYLSKFGTVVTTSVIYHRYKEGPFKRKYNGDRKYQVDFTKSSVSMGTFHIIDGSRFRVFYPGNKIFAKEKQLLKIVKKLEAPELNLWST